VSGGPAELLAFEPKLELLCRVYLRLRGFCDVRDEAHGRRVVFAVESGWFEGPEFRGDVWPGLTSCYIGEQGADWADDCLQLRTYDGHAISLHNRVVAHAPEAVHRQLDRWEDIDPSALRLCGHAWFETATDTPYSWLNATTAVAVGAVAVGGTELIYGVSVCDFATP
jgi:hypothetical protein